MHFSGHCNYANAKQIFVLIRQRYKGIRKKFIIAHFEMLLPI